MWHSPPKRTSEDFMKKSFLFLLVSLCLGSSSHAAIAEFRFHTVNAVGDQFISGITSDVVITKHLIDSPAQRYRLQGKNKVSVSAERFQGKASITPQCSQLASVALSTSVPTILIVQANVPDNEDFSKNGNKFILSNMRCILTKSL